MRKIAYEMPIDLILDELVYVETRLAAENLTKDLPPTIDKLITQGKNVRDSLFDAQRKVISNLAKVDSLVLQVDQFSRTLDLTIRISLKNSIHYRENNLYQRYFRNISPSQVSKQSSANHIELMRNWLSFLKGESEKPLFDLSKELTALITQYELLAKNKDTAEAERLDARHKLQNGFIDQVNQAIMTLEAELLQRAVKNNLPRDWSKSFMRKSTVKSAAKKPKEKPSSH